MRQPFEVAGSWMGNYPDPLVADARCVWLVTVHAPYQQSHAPYGIKPQTFAQYTVMVDVASGASLGLAAGDRIPDVVDQTGLVAAKPQG